MKFWLLTRTLNQVLMLVSLKAILKRSKKKKRITTTSNNKQQASADIETQAAMSGGLPTWGPPQRRNTNIDPFVSPAKGVKRSEAPHINKDSSPLPVLMMFFTEIFRLLVEQTNVYYQQHLDRQAGPSR